MCLSKTFPNSSMSNDYNNLYIGYSSIRADRPYKAKGNLKTGVTRKERTPNFPKNEHLNPDTGGKKREVSLLITKVSYLK